MLKTTYSILTFYNAQRHVLAERTDNRSVDQLETAIEELAIGLHNTAAGTQFVRISDVSNPLIYRQIDLQHYRQAKMQYQALHGPRPRIEITS